MADLDLPTVDTLLSTTRAVRKRLDFSRPVQRERDPRVPAAGDPGAHRLQRAAVALARGRGPRHPRHTRGAVPQPAPGAPGSREARPEVTPQQERVTESALYLQDHLEEVPVLVIPCTLKKGGAAGWQPSIYPAVWSFMLALRSRGLGSCLTTAHLFRERDAAELLGIPDDYAQACLVPVAYYTGTGFRPAVRRPVEELTYWDRWDTAT